MVRFKEGEIVFRSKVRIYIIYMFILNKYDKGFW